ncbi:MAG: hypothetical protein CVV44_03880 [Spirochaetae bacterium HGW-Spirochaetae-1]|jgi:hypothetical protein|nr:MAG: hypothetical protein CVV44_03880 [Spirochaetae bacterium HGW-Spirochaetae-1]
MTTYDFPGLVEKTLSDKQVTVANNLGRAVENLELVHLDGYFGEVKEYDGIADGASGKINIDHERTIETDQIAAADTFVVGQIVFFAPGGSSAAGAIRAANAAGRIPVGICTEFGGSAGAHTFVVFRPFAQGNEALIGGALKAKRIAVPTGSHAAGAPVVNADIPVGSQIVGIIGQALATVSSEDVTVTDGTNTIGVVPIATVNALSFGTLINAYSVVVAAGLTLTADTTNGTGIITVLYI